MPEPKRVLFVDDDPVYRDILSAVLAKAGYAVEPAADCGSALARVQGDPPDLLICDIVLPGLDGWRTVRHLRSLPSLALVPVIFLTVLQEVERPRDGFGLDMDVVVHKGDGPQALLDALAEASRCREALIAQVRAGLASDEGLSGDLAVLGPATVMALADRHGFTGEITLARDGEHARLLVRDGQVLRAILIGDVVCQDDACIFRILDWHAGRFQFRRCSVETTGSIRVPTSKLLQAHAAR